MLSDKYQGFYLIIKETQADAYSDFCSIAFDFKTIINPEQAKSILDRVVDTLSKLVLHVFQKPMVTADRLFDLGLSVYETELMLKAIEYQIKDQEFPITDIKELEITIDFINEIRKLVTDYFESTGSPLLDYRLTFGNMRHKLLTTQVRQFQKEDLEINDVISMMNEWWDDRVKEYESSFLYLLKIGKDAGKLNYSIIMED